MPELTRPRVLVVEDDADLRDALTETLGCAGYATCAAADGAEALALARQQPVQLILSDVQMQTMDGLQLLTAAREEFPGVPVILMTAYASVDHAVEAMQLGAETYLGKPFETDALLEVVADTLSRRRALTSSAVDTGAVVCGDPVTVSLLGVANRVARSEATVLLTGASGAGKEVFARYIHTQSKRAGQPWVAINCAAIPEQMLEATLFGYERGAFTGAHQARPGKFEQANGGTLLLDEVTEMELGLQAKLLRVLQEREVERLGSGKTTPVDVRVLATSNRDLATAVRRGEFREDLYYRLNVFPLHVPSLADRRGDVLPLFRHFVRQYCDGAAPPSLARCAERTLLAYEWPGNVRELDNMVQRTLILLASDTISASDLVFDAPGQFFTAPTQDAEPTAQDGSLQHDMKAAEQRRICDALEAEDGNRTEAAKSLGISPRTLRYKMARLREAGYTFPEHLARRTARATAV